MSDQFIYGMHAVRAALSELKRPVKKIYVSSHREDVLIQNLVKLAEERRIPLVRYNVAQMDNQFKDANHQGIAALVAPLPTYSEQDIPTLLSHCKAKPFILILDGVTDPHNLGACLRTADGAGVDFVMFPKDKNADVTSVVSKVACGAAESIPLVKVTNLVRAMEVLKAEGVWIYGACGEESTSIYQIDFTGPVALVLGSEGNGLRRLTREHCDGLYFLPMQGQVSSLNVSVAAGVSLYEVVRQRR